MPKTKTPARFGHASFTVYSPEVIRLEYNKNDRFPTTSSIITAPELPRPLAAEISRKGKRISIETGRLKLVHIDDGKQFSRENLSIEYPGLQGRPKRRMPGGRATWHPGDPDEPAGTLLRSLDAWPSLERFYREDHPSLLDRLGRRCIVDDAQVYRNADNTWVEVTAEDLRGQDWWFFGYGANYTGALQDFVRIFGRIPLVPRWVFGFWYSRWYEYCADDIVKIAERYRKSGLPMDVMVVDTEWRTHNWNGYDWHRKRFPRPKEFIRRLKKMGLVVPLNDHPGYDAADPLPSCDTLIPGLRKKLKEPPRQGVWACDWSSKSCTETWKDTVLAKQFKDGMDFWWVDGWTEPPFRRVEGQLWANRHYYEVAEKQTKKRGLILSRWGGWGSHRYPVQFSGDTDSTWETLKKQIRFTADSGGAGACYWSHDIGGFFKPIIDDDLYIRWVQFGAFSPVFRTHSAFGTREPFAYSELAQKVFKHVTRWRYAMTPYYYHLAREAHDTGLPICRPMYLHYPLCGPAYIHRDQYMIGQDMLIVPGHRDGKVVQRSWWVPGGTWVCPETGDMFESDGERQMSIPLDRIPVFYRLGSIVPHQKPGLTTRENQFGPLYLDIYPSDYGIAEIDLYEDDGETREYENGRYTRTRITCAKSGGEITVEIDPSRGSFKGKPRGREVHLNIWFDPGSTVTQVELNGESVPKSGWSLTRGYAADVCKGVSRYLRVSCKQGKSTVRVRAFAG